MPRLLLTLAALTTSIVLAAGCGNDEASTSSDAAALAPAGSFLYAEATLRPEGDQKAAIDNLVSKFPGEGSAGERIRRLLDTAMSESDSKLSYADDIEPWLGDEAAFFVSGLSPSGEEPDAAAMVATEDEDASVAAIEKDEEDAKKSDYKGHALYLLSEDDGAAAVVDGWVLLGNAGGVKAAIDTAEGGEAIEGDERFKSTLEDAADDRLGFMYVDLPGVIEQVEKSPDAAALGQFRDLFKEPVLVTADADDNGVRFEGTVPVSALAGLPFVAEGSAIVDELPADSWLAMAQPDLGKTIDVYVNLLAGTVGGRDVIAQQLKAATGLDLEEDVVSWMGDWGVFVRGASVADLNGALILETSDEAASGRFIDAMVKLIRDTGGGDVSVGALRAPGGGQGATLTGPDVPQPVHFFQRDGKVVLAFGDAAARDAFDPAERLGDSAGFTEAKEALGGDYAVSFYVAMGPILDLAESAGAGASAEFQEALPYLEPLGALVGGARKDGDDVRSAFGLTVK